MLMKKIYWGIINMGKTRYTRITYKGKYEYIWDQEGKYIRKNNNFMVDKTDRSGNIKLKQEFNKLVKGHPYIKQRVNKIINLEKKIYYTKVWLMTEENDLTTLKNHKKRSFRGYHLDHVYPISEAFKNDIPPEVVSDIRNLKFIPAKKNLKKRDTITEDARKLINKIQKKPK